MDVAEVKRRIAPVLERHGVVRASLFGSIARREADDGSDVDILVEIGGNPGLLELSALKLDLEEALGRSVDVVTYGSLHPRVRSAAVEDEVPVL